MLSAILSFVPRPTLKPTDEVALKASSQESRHYHGHRQRLRERFVKGGLEGFAEHEVVELLLTLAIPRSDVKEPAKELLKKFGNLRAILDAPPDELSSVKGIGSVAPVALKIVRSAATLYLQQCSEEEEVLLEPEQFRDFWRMRLSEERNEVFEAAYLDSGFRLMRSGVERMTEGTIDRAAVYPRRVIEGALKHGASAILLAHNHPNGNVTPSEQDKMLTRAIVLAAEPLSLQVADHVIVSPDEVFSFREAGLL